MKHNIITVVLGLASGFAGAYLFSLTAGEAASPTGNNSASQQSSFASHWQTGKQVLEVTDFAKASEASTKSVVYIKTISSQQYQRNTWFDMFFNPNQGGQQEVSGSGSGVILSEDGYIVTNSHVIKGADGIEVVHQKRTYTAKLIGTDPSTDLALLKIEAQGLPAIPIGTSKNLMVGQWVLAVGNPFNLTSTVTAGIVSAKGRKINILEGLFPIESFIQTDAAINPGNSGGALVNRDGQLVGINTAILSQTGSYSGYGFAVPIDIAIKVVNDLKKHGQVQKAFMGADVMDVNQEVAQRMSLPNYDGALITQVDEESGAAKAGLERGDIIVGINGEAIDSESSFDEHLSYYAPGARVKVAFLRDGKRKEAEVVLTNIEGTTGIAKRETFNASNIGASFEVVPKVERQRLGIEGGIRIAKVEPNGLIARMGLGEGFIIVGVNKQAIATPQEFSSILEKVRGRVVLQGVNQAGKYQYYSYYF